jgi:hypothetical protein
VKHTHFAQSDDRNLNSLHTEVSPNNVQDYIITSPFFITTRKLKTTGYS